ncbi:MAG: GH3 auxin-responsive promoter family protein, partial [Alphaproteobacteria bacterium]|nr:GH3 auxin-responsive promoter family protein [Alphaproteobacteria bacterium]
MTARMYGHEWLEKTLLENRDCSYLKGLGSPQNLEAFRAQVPPTVYSQLEGYIGDICNGKTDILFSGSPVAFEKTGGSSGGAKLIPYSASGLRDFRTVLSCCLKNVLNKFGITGSIYLSTSPVTRAPQLIGGVPVGVSDADYLDHEMGKFVYEHSAVSFDVAKTQDINTWKEKTLFSLMQARDLQFISVWSPIFLISLLRDVPDAARLFPDLRVISCWTSGASGHYARQLQAMFPDVKIMPKGLMSTEAVVTYNDLD